MADCGCTPEVSKFAASALLAAGNATGVASVAVAGGTSSTPGVAPRRLFPRFGDDDLVYAPMGGGFAELVGEVLGNAGTEHDGFESMFGDAATALGGEGDVGAVLDGHLAEASFVGGDFAESTFAPITGTLKDFYDAGDGIMTQFGGAVDTGGGTGGGGTGGGGGGTGGTGGSGGGTGGTGGGGGEGDWTVHPSPGSGGDIGATCGWHIVVGDSGFPEYQFYGKCVD